MERTFLPMSCWAAEDIPSNKIIDANPENMSNAELLSIIIGTGSKNESALELARKILAQCDNKLSMLAKKAPNQLIYMHGVGKQKTAKILDDLGDYEEEIENARSNEDPHESEDCQDFYEERQYAKRHDE